MEDGDILDFDFGSDEPDESEEKDEKIKIEQFIDAKMTATNLNQFFRCDYHGNLSITTFSVKANRDYLKGTTFSICNLLQGEIRVLGALSLITTNFPGKKPLNIGWSKYRTTHREWTKTNFKGFGTLKPKASQSFLDHLPSQSIRLGGMTAVEVVVQTVQDGKKGDLIEGYIIYIKQ